jgi:hypothetical protein
MNGTRKFVSRSRQVADGWTRFVNEAKGPTSLMGCGDGGQCLHEASVFLEIEERPRSYRVSESEEEQGSISSLSCARGDSSSLRIYVLRWHAGLGGTL